MVHRALLRTAGPALPGTAHSRRQPIGFAEAGAAIGRAIGRDVAYRQLTREQFASAAILAGLPTEDATRLAELFAQVLDGRNSTATCDIEQILGRPAIDFDTFVHRALAVGAWQSGWPGDVDPPIVTPPPPDNRASGWLITC